MKRSIVTGRLIKVIKAALILMNLVIFFSITMSTQIAHAKFDWIDDTPTDENPVFNQPKKAIEETSAGLYEAVFYGVVAAMMIGSICIGVALALKNSRTRSETKAQLPRFMVAAIIIFGMLGLVALAAGIGRSIGR